MPYLGNYLWYTGDAQNIFDLIQSIGTHDLGQQQAMMEPTCPYGLFITSRMQEPRRAFPDNSCFVSSRRLVRGFAFLSGRPGGKIQYPPAYAGVSI